MTLNRVIRTFKFNDHHFPDPAPDQSLEVVRVALAAQQAGILNATLEGPLMDGETAVYTFVGKLGTKG